MKKYIFIIVAIVAVLAIYFFVFPGSPADSPVPGANGNEPAVVLGDSYKTASYTIEGSIVTLAVPTDSSGKTRYFGNEAKGDLNGDGTEDVAFIIVNNPGGSGAFYYVVAALNADGGYVGTNAQFLGDRIAPQSTQIVDGDLIVNFADRKSGEPMTAKPTVGVTSYYEVDGQSLVYTGSR